MTVASRQSFAWSPTRAPAARAPSSTDRMTVAAPTTWLLRWDPGPRPRRRSTGSTTSSEPASAPSTCQAAVARLGRLLTVVDRDGIDETRTALDVHLQQLTAAVAGRDRVVRRVDALASPSDPRPVDHLRLVAAGPLPVDDLEAAPEDEPPDTRPRPR